MEAAIPISILAIGLARVYSRRSSLLENVIITGIGGVSGAVVAGAIFTLPALYILKLDPHPWQTIFICLAGGCLGVLFLIPLRRYFVREMHGQFPYPGGDRDHRGAGHRREGRLAGEAAPAGDRNRRRLRLLRHDLPGLEGDRRLPVRPARRTRSPRRRGWSCASTRSRSSSASATSWACAPRCFCARAACLANFVLVPLIWLIGQHFPDAGLPGHGARSRRWRPSRSSAATCGSSASARSRRPASSGSSSRCKIVVGSFAIAAKAFRHGEHAQHGADRPRHRDHEDPRRRRRLRRRRRDLPRQSRNDVGRSPSSAWG